MAQNTTNKNKQGDSSSLKITWNMLQNLFKNYVMAKAIFTN